MDLPNLAFDSATIVVRGYFNPAVLSSAWMLSEGLITAEDVVEAKHQIATPDAANFETSWFTFLAGREVIQVTTTQPEDFERVRDLAAGILRALPETPVAVMGINRDAHFLVDTIKEWHAIGDKLVPKAVWKEVLEDPGMNTVAILGLRPDSYSGNIQVLVQPSAQFPLGVFVSHNDHYALEKAETKLTSRDQLVVFGAKAPEAKPEKSAVAIEILIENWADSMNRAEKVIGHIAQQART